LARGGTQLDRLRVRDRGAGPGVSVADRGRTILVTTLAQTAARYPASPLDKAFRTTKACTAVA